ncbi:MAG: DMT family transporter [Pseudomonadota bacterium]
MLNDHEPPFQAPGPFRPLLMLLIGAVMISFSSVYVKIAHVSPSVSAFYRVFFGALVLMGMAVFRQRFRWRGRRYLMLAAVCSGSFALDLFLWHRSIHFVGPGLATLLANFQVFILAAIGIVVLKEPFRWRIAVAIPMAFCGLVLIVGIDWGQLGAAYRLGVVFGLLAALCYSVYLISLKRIQSLPAGLPPLENLAVVSLMAAGWLAVDIWYSGESFHIPDTTSTLALLAYGVFSQVAGWVIIASALPRVRASFAGLALLLQPTLAYVWDVLFFHRAVSLLNLAGVALAICGIYLGTSSAAAQKPLPVDADAAGPFSRRF